MKTALLRDARLLLFCLSAIFALRGTQNLTISLYPFDGGGADLLPIWLGARALVQGLDPCDPGVLSAEFSTADLNVRVGGFLSYYPPTASLFMMPFAEMPFRWVSSAFRVLLAIGLALSAWCCATAGRPRDALSTWTATFALIGVFFTVQPLLGGLEAGQPNPLIVFATAAALAGLARGRDTAAGLIAALGVSLKLFPLILVPAALRRPRFLVAGGALLLGMVLVVAAKAPLESLTSWPARVLGFVGHPRDANGFPNATLLVKTLLMQRLSGLGIATLAIAAVSLRGPSTPTRTVATGGVLVAWGGAVMGPNPQYHESLVLLPAIGLLLSLPALQGSLRLAWGLAIATAATLYWGDAFATGRPGGNLNWLWIGYAIWALSVVRWGFAMWEDTYGARKDVDER